MTADGTSRDADAVVVSGAMNFRDTGGLPAGAGRTRSGILFRSGNLARVDDAGRASLGALGIRRVIDLRDEQEVTSAPSLVDGLGIELAYTAGAGTLAVGAVLFGLSDRRGR